MQFTKIRRAALAGGLAIALAPALATTAVSAGEGSETSRESQRMKDGGGYSMDESSTSRQAVQEQVLDRYGVKAEDLSRFEKIAAEAGISVSATEVIIDAWSNDGQVFVATAHFDDAFTQTHGMGNVASDAWPEFLPAGERVSEQSDDSRTEMVGISSSCTRSTTVTGPTKTSAGYAQTRVHAKRSSGCGSAAPRVCAVIAMKNLAGFWHHQKESCARMDGATYAVTLYVSYKCSDSKTRTWGSDGYWHGGDLTPITKPLSCRHTR